MLSRRMPGLDQTPAGSHWPEIRSQKKFSVSFSEKNIQMFPNVSFLPELLDTPTLIAAGLGYFRVH